ncbi:MAG: DNA polymerase III subunit alpha, partial [Lachnospiraceae bacterium]|nr:DNA polymerase III subunit alpha [Lachnospiraceae bacterium]
IDVDFEDSQRLRVINDYIFDKYGRDCVSQITTFQNMKAKAVLKDVGRALGLPFNETNRVSKMIPNELNITLADALKKNPELKAYAQESQEHKQWFTYAMELEGIPKATGVHAAGVVIYPGRADECMPQGRAKDGTPACEYNMIQLEQLGYLKMDFLGLRTLTVVKDAVANVKKTRGIDLDMDHMDYDDPKTLEFIGSGKTSGVFQLESAGMQSFMKELRPSGFEDIIAGISLYRPGPMEFIPSYIKGKDDPEHVVYKCRALEPILKDTYGCIVYQEQVMQIVQQLAGYSLGQADIMRRAMSKKHQDEIDAGRHTFVYGNGDEVGEGEKGYVPGCIRNGICDTPQESERVANEIYDSMLDFAKYAFNKSHAASYAVLSMQTAYLKLYYPQEFFAALLTSVIDSSGKLSEYLGVCRGMGIEVLPPDVSAGTGEFSVHEGRIKYGMYAVKGVGPVLIDGLVRERELNGDYTSFQNFLERTMPLGVNKRAVENLIKAGALDCFGANRRQMVYGYPGIMDDIAADQKNSLSGQMSLFDLVDEEERKQYEAKLPEVEEFPRDVLLSFEKEVLGIYVSGHPLEDDLSLLKKNVTLKTTEFLWEEDKQRTGVSENQRGVMGGILLDKTIKFTKSGAPMAFLTIEDLYGTVEVILFPKIFERYRDILNEDTKLLIAGHASVEEDKDAKLIADDLICFSEVSKEVWLRFPNLAAYEQKQEQIEGLIRESDGCDTMTIYLEDRRAIRKMGHRFSFRADPAMLKGIAELVGEENLSVVSGTWK